MAELGSVALTGTCEQIKARGRRRVQGPTRRDRATQRCDASAVSPAGVLRPPKRASQPAKEGWGGAQPSPVLRLLDDAGPCIVFVAAPCNRPRGAPNATRSSFATGCWFLAGTVQQKSWSCQSRPGHAWPVPAGNGEAHSSPRHEEPVSKRQPELRCSDGLWRPSQEKRLSRPVCRPERVHARRARVVRGPCRCRGYCPQGHTVPHVRPRAHSGGKTPGLD